MAKLVDLPNEGTEALKSFNKLLNKPDETLVLILGNDVVAKDAYKYVKQIVDANKNNPFYRFINFVIATNPKYILSKLQSLQNKSNIDFIEIGEYVIISISPYRNIISEAVTKQRFKKGKGSINTAIITAIANG